MIDALLAPFYKWIILVLLLFMTGYVWYCNSLAGDLRNAETACDVSVAKTIKPYEDAIDQAQKQKSHHHANMVSKNNRGRTECD